MLRVPAVNSAFGKPHPVIVRRGWSAEVWALVPGARLEEWTPDGDLLVSSPANGSVTELLPERVRSRPPLRRVLLSGLDDPQGMAFTTLAGHVYLFVAETDEIDRYVWHDGTPSARTVIVRDLPDGGAHPLKNVVVAPDHTSTSTSAARRTRQHRVPVPPILWRVRRRLPTFMQTYVNDHPPDELARLTPGRNLGWPYCNPDPDARPGRAGTAYDYADMRFDSDAQTNPGGRALNCAALARIQRGLPAHSAPLGFHFLEGSRLPVPWSDGAVVAVHGSWDRDPPRSPAVLWLPWETGAETLGAPITLVGGFQEPDGSRWGRPVDAVPGPDGALYVSDDLAGAIYRLVPPS